MGAARIMIVDDSPTQRKLAVAALESQGYQVIVASDGEEALQLVGKECPDLIILDIILPRKNGFQVCRQLRTTEATQHVKILLLTSKRQDADRFWGLKQGADLYLTKPYEDEELFKGIESLLH